MPHYLDSLPFDWSQPAARELRDFLADTYYREEPVIPIAQQAGIRLADIGWGRPMSLVWHELLEKARNQDRLHALLGHIESSADTAVGLRLQELVQAAPVLEAPRAPAPDTWKHFTAPDAKERQIFKTYSLLDVAFLRRGVELAPAVARLLVTMPTGRQYHGTAFRIDADTLLTNHHVLFDDAAAGLPASSVEAWFGYERDHSGRDLAHTVVACVPDTIRGDRQYDWAIIKVAEAMPDEAPAIGLSDAAPVAVGDRVYIIQHPRGGVKKIGVHHNTVRHVNDDVVQYWTDTEAGSSGSPVFDEQWRLVALHHRWVEEGVGDAREFRNQGVRIQRVADGLAAAGVV
ncbi:trypsin-like peptidase domain-containing protein [Streptomyces sp. NPDC091280]|uniref:trypsin-like peptidase domain-containing protein n=1 Tax=Streptomyces sp. NPDC091280 TaxID=3365984 RepID=UPI0037FCC3AE